MEAKEYYRKTRIIDTMRWTLDMVMNFAEEYHKNEIEALHSHDISRRTEQSNCVHCHEHILTVKTLKYRCKHCGDEKWEQLD